MRLIYDFLAERHFFIADSQKTAKYLARLSHALAIIKMLKDNTNTQFILSESNLEEFKNDEACDWMGDCRDSPDPG